MKKLLITAGFALFALSISSAAKFTTAKGITITFNGTENNSVQVEATCKKFKANAKAYEWNVPASKVDFAILEDGSYFWNDYVITPVEEGYTLSYKGKEMYTSTFEDEKGKQLCEARMWKDAKKFYGFGQHSRQFNLSDQVFKLYNESKYGDHAYITIPFFVTDSNASCYYTANGNDQMYFQNENISQKYRSSTMRINSYVKQMETIPEAVSEFYADTESSALLPKWAFGYIQSKYGYKTQQEVVDLIKEFKTRQIPLSAVVLDVYWFNKMGDIDWTNTRDWPDVAGLNNYMEENGVKLITITEPFYCTDTANYAELKSKGMLLKNDQKKIADWRDWWCLNGSKSGGIVNPIHKKASKFFGEKYSKMIDSGIDAFWTDLGEPERAPKNLMYGKLKEEEFHNYYNYYWSQSIYNGVKTKYPDRRMFMLSRSAYTGSGKFGVSVWSGDIAVSWPSLKQQVPFALNCGLSGISYWGSDIGGFVNEKTYPELFVRWQQFGAFTPIYRAHGTGPREPWIFGDEETAIISKYINYRYTLLPYIYSTSRQVLDGIPMMRPMFYEDIDTPDEFLENQYMFGDSLLVCPVYKPIKDEPNKEIYLPKGNWYNFETLKKVQGGKTITVKSDISSLPVFIKEGAIIPATVEGKDYLYILPADGIKNSFTYYNDDGETDNYKSGDFVKVEYKLEGSKLTAKISGDKKYAPKEITVVSPKGSYTTTIEALAK